MLLRGFGAKLLEERVDTLSLGEVDTELLEERVDILLSLGVDTELLEESGDVLLSLGEVDTELPLIEGGNFLLVEAMLLEGNTM